MCCRDAAYTAQRKEYDMWIVRYGGWTIWEGDDEEKANEEYRACGPYGTICEVKG